MIGLLFGDLADSGLTSGGVGEAEPGVWGRGGRVVGYAILGEKSCAGGIGMPRLLPCGIHVSGGACLCAGLVPTLAAESGRGRTGGSGAGITIGCGSLGV
jgi:hypothetical protein